MMYSYRTNPPRPVFLAVIDLAWVDQMYAQIRIKISKRAIRDRTMPVDNGLVFTCQICMHVDLAIGPLRWQEQTSGGTLSHSEIGDIMPNKSESFQF